MSESMTISANPIGISTDNVVFQCEKCAYNFLSFDKGSVLKVPSKSDITFLCPVCHGDD